MSTKQPRPHPQTGTSSIFQATRPAHPGYNELLDESGSLRPRWQSIVAALDSLGGENLQRRQARTNRMRFEDGATFNPFADPDGQSSAWSLDMLPLPLDEGDWQHIESGIVQRAQLLEAVLEDVYGRQQLLKKGNIPAELVYANPNFLRPCHSIVPAGGRFLCLYAADIYRDADGTFKVLRDYGSHPAGLGYALENRIVLSRIFSELYHQSRIRRLAPFFNQLHRGILERKAPGRRDPGIVLLSPGPECQTYFEHAFLSRYLGYPLVEGQDLTVRDGQVFLKKLAGLDPVEVIFRHVADIGSDPFALGRQSPHGVAGLVQAAREGTIDLVNPLGSGFIDTPLLGSLLPSLCPLVRGEELRLPSRRIWWGGDPENLQRILANPEWMERSLDRNGPPLAGDDLAAAVQLQPQEFMAAEPIAPSLAPAWNDGTIEYQPILLRVFACATADGFAVMPGGLAITSPRVSTLLRGSPKQQQSRDIWLLSNQPIDPFSLLSTLQSTAEFSRSSDLPSRVADNLLWLGRYLERAECRVRLLRAILRRISGEARLQDIPELSFLLQLQGMPVQEMQDNRQRYRRLLTLIGDCLYNRDNLGSIIAILKKVQETARNVRDRLSLDCWRVINHFENFLERSADDPLELLDDTLYNLSAFSGLAMESMTRGFGWRFMDMGRRLERAMFQNGILQTGLPQVCSNPQNTLEALLEIGDSTMTYRARYRTTCQLALVLDLLIVDESNPKSLAFQFSQLAAHVDQLPRQEERRFSSIEERLALEMLTATRLLDLRHLACENDGPAPLGDYLMATEQRLVQFARSITAHYLSRVPATPHFSSYYEPGDG